MSWIENWLLLFRVRELADLDLDPHADDLNLNTENTVLHQLKRRLLCTHVVLSTSWPYIA